MDERPRLAGGRANVASVALEPLSEQETDELIDALRGDTELSGETRSRISTTAEGNPLFIEQMLAMVAEQGADGGGEVAIPPTIHALLAARLERLGPGERSILERGSVIGREFSRNALVELPKDEWPAVGGALEGLVRRELLRPVQDDAFGFDICCCSRSPTTPSPSSSVPSSTSVMETGSSRTAGTRRSSATTSSGRTHTAPRWPRRRRGPGSCPARRDAPRRRRAPGVRARRPPCGRWLLSRAADLLEPGAAGRVELLADLGEALRETGEFDRAESVLEEVIQTASAAGDDVLEARAQVIRLSLRLLTDPEVTEEVVRQAEPLIETFEQAGDDRLLAKAWELLAWAPWFHCRAAATVDALERAIEHARRAGDARTEAQSLNLSIGAAFFGPMPAPDAIRLCEEILADPLQQQRNRASALGRSPASRRWWARSARRASSSTRTRRSCRSSGFA